MIDCMLWPRSTNSWGYGAVYDQGRMRGAHVVAWEKRHGRKVPKGKCVLHTCDVRTCVNPDHLYLGTKARNSLDMVERGRSARGTKNGRAKFNPDTILQVFRDPGAHSAIGRQFSMSRRQVSQIKSGARWSWLTQGDVP
jgi:hypothetical protein